MLEPKVMKLLLDGTVIPAHPLALNRNRQLDETSQRRLTNYYMDSGAGGIAVGVHTTQFEIRDPMFNLYEKVLRLAAEEVDKRELQHPFIKVAGICGSTEQAEREAFIARSMGYDLGLLSPGGLNDLTEAEMLERTSRVSEILPVFGFYLQPSVGGRVFSYDFWRAFADIPNVHAIKMAPFNRYQTLDVIRAVCHSERRDEIALYTGNDDNIVQDLLTSYEIIVEGQTVRKEIVGGLLGHWAVWTKKAVELLDEIKQVRNSGSIPASLLQKSLEITDANAVFFDAANGFKGCIAGINEVLARQGLLQGNWCLLEKEHLSPGQSEEIDRVYRDYPHLNDDDFVKACMHSS
ncbi:Dihydrodipicolinate synthase/N-acetylneuraminate lyase [Fictibacillus enclensis]|uniref:Dihydrodipicolinate synthetase n=1 Tax=Fictibacillus enclensis TaxID=1017270 RepID=A0A0V8J4U8_9BACL|nr:dihydrodipicolinate synthase family protein [Fictibacillus enclensis]KSU81969.1 dihydrodipicolinate synthetase [Fictibacillus enclensis]SCC28467.1 Dihydrodipicolinate synthase/N-acetylneuraminate lyase [Fictibacillus enclensis]